MEPWIFSPGHSGRTTGARTVRLPSRIPNHSGCLSNSSSGSHRCIEWSPSERYMHRASSIARMARRRSGLKEAQWWLLRFHRL